MRAKYAKQIRLGILNAKSDIRNWGDNEGSKLFRLVVSATINSTLSAYPVQIGRAYRATIKKFYDKGGNIDG